MIPISGKTDFQGKNSRCHQVAQAIEQDIQKGRLLPGMRLKSVRDLAAQFDVSPMVISDALDILTSKNLLTRLPRRGIFVNVALYKQCLLVLFDKNSDSTDTWHQIYPHINEAAVLQGWAVESYDFFEFANLTSDQVLNFVNSNHITGVILLANHFLGNEPIISLLKSVPIPVVIASALQEDSPNTGFASVRSDSSKSWLAALSHLRDQGFRRVLTLVYQRNDGLIRRFAPQDYLKELIKLGLDADPALILKLKDNSYTTLKAALEQIYTKNNQPPRAIQCFSDFMALQVYRSLTELGLRIPQDVAVMGYCGATIGLALNPSLSTIDVGYAEMGRQAVQLIHNSAQWFVPGTLIDDIPQIVVNFHLLSKDSTAINHFEAYPSPELPSSPALNSTPPRRI